MTSLSSTFRALLREATFTKQMLGAGATYIYKANYAFHGMYFQAFSSLSVGLERLGKLCVMLDHAIDNEGAFPTDADMKVVGHDLVKLYNQSQVIKANRRLTFSSLQDLSDPVRFSILEILSSFAKGDRYSNIDLLSGKAKGKDPISVWASKVDANLYKEKVSAKRKSLIREKAAQSASMDEISFVFHTADDGTSISSCGDAARHTLTYEAVAPYRQLLVLQIVRYWVDLLCDLGMLARTVMPLDVPEFNEILGSLANDDGYIRGRKTWDKI